MSQSLHPSAQKVQEALKAAGFQNQVIEIPSSTRTSVEAAQAVGCQVGQIAKSIVFRGQKTDQPILVVASGINRVNERRVEEWLGEPLGKADAHFVRMKTGFVIGGVPPIGHLENMTIFIDEDLLHHEEIWAAAGTPNALFKLTPNELLKMTGGKVIAIK